MENKPYSLQSPEKIAEEYGGNKQKIAQAVQMGIVDPTAGLLAGMFIDRMRSAQAMEQAPQQTVAQQVFTPPRPATPAGLGATPQAQAPQMNAIPAAAAQAPAPAPMGMASGGLTDLDVPENMFHAGSTFAGGGLIAFGDGGDVKGYSDGDYVMTPDAAQITPFSESLVGNFWGGIPRALSAAAQAAGASEYNQAAMGANAMAELFGGRTMPLMVPKALASQPAAPTPAAAPSGYTNTLGQVDLTPFNPNQASPFNVPNLTSGLGVLPRLPGNVGGGSNIPATTGNDMTDTVGEANRVMNGLEAMGVKKPQTFDEIYADLSSRTGDPSQLAGVKSLQDYLDNAGSRLAQQKEEDKWTALAQIGFGMAGTKSPFALQALGEAATAAMPTIEKNIQTERENERQNTMAQADLDLKMFGFKQQDIKDAMQEYYHQYDAYNNMAGKALEDAENNRRAWQIAQSNQAAELARTKLQEAGAMARTQYQVEKTPEIYAGVLYAQSKGDPNNPALIREGMAQYSSQRLSGIYGSTQERAAVAADAAAQKDIAAGGVAAAQYQKALQNDAAAVKAGKLNPGTADALYASLVKRHMSAIPAAAIGAAPTGTMSYKDYFGAE